MNRPGTSISVQFLDTYVSLMKQYYHQNFPNCFRRLSSVFSSGGDDVLQLHSFILWSTAAAIFVLCCLHLKKKFKNIEIVGSFQALNLSPIIKDHEELSVQEALLVSLIATQVASNASSSVQARDTIDTELLKVGQEFQSAPQSTCEICFETKERWQMFKTNCCSHNFCFDCTSKHIVAKIEENVKMISCPGINCNAPLDFDACRLLIPDYAVVQWDELLCKSLIPDSQKLYCPFIDCSTLLVDDTGIVAKKIKCPLCKRLFCACCRVPWHSEFTCNEFQSLSGKKRGKEDLMVKSLAKKKNWQKCPNCKMYVERSGGCLHMTCRCLHEFCYRCGSKWSGSHNSCWPKKMVRMLGAATYCGGTFRRIVLKH